MATEESKLVVAVDSTSVPKAGAQLDAYTASATKADAATGKLAQTSRAAGAAQAAAAADVSRAEQAVNAFGETQAQVDARLRSVAQAAVAERDAMAKQAATMAEATTVARGYSEASKQQVAAQTAQMAAWTRSRAPVVELEAILGKTTLTTAEVAKANALLDKAQASGVISAGELAAAFKALDAAKIKDVAITEAQAAANKTTGLSSRAQAEIATGVSEVLSGNFSRLRRTGAAFANQAGLLTQLMSPMGLAIVGVTGAVIALVAAYTQGERETLAFTRALATTGDQSGVTGAQLSTMALAIGGATGEFNDSTKAVLALAQAGLGASPALEGMAETAVRFGKATGDIKTGIEFATVAMSGSAKQIEDLDRKYNLLTASQADEVQYLFQIGEADKARQIVMRDGSAALAKRAQEVEDSTGSIIKAWNAVTSAVSSAWHEMEHAGATDVASRLKAVNDQLAQAQGVHMNASQQFVPNASPGQIGNLKALQGQLQAQLIQQGWDRTNQALDDARNKAAKGAQEWAAAALSPIDQLQSKLDVAVKMKDAFFAVPRTAEESARFMRSYNQQIALAAQGYESGLRKVNPTSRQKANPLASFTGYVNNIVANSQGNAYDDSGIGKYVTSVEKLYAEFHKQINAGADVNKSIEQYDRAIQALGNDLAVTTAKQNAADAAYKAQLDQQLATRRNAIELQVASVGMGQQEYQQYQALNEVYQQFDHQLAQLNKERDARNITMDQYNKRLAELKQNESDTVAAVVDGYKRMDSAREDWMNGLTSSWQNYIDQGKDVAGMTAQTFSDAFGGMENAMVNFVQTGKLSFKDLADSIISDLVRMETRILISKALSSILGSFTTSGTGIAGDYMASGGSSYATSGVNWSPYANGGVFNSPSLSAYSGQIVTQPTFFAFARGAGVMGEAGPEAVMPLSRGPDGKLGVKAQGGGTTVIVENHSDSQAQVQQSQDGNGNDLIRVVVGAAMNEWNSQVQRGGQSYKTLQQVFGLNRRGVPVAG